MDVFVIHALYIYIYTSFCLFCMDVFVIHALYIYIL